MAGFSEGAPCWVDVTLPDHQAGKMFYGELFGWTFMEGPEEYGSYTTAYSDGKDAAALAPQMPGQEEVPPAWTLYFASTDVGATAAKVRQNGGEVLMEPMAVGEFGSMVLAADPGGTMFGAWQAGRHPGFQRQGVPGTFCWAEVVTRDPEAADAFFPAVFPFEAARMEAPEGMDYKVWKVAGETVAGRFRMPTEAPAAIPSHVEIYFAVEDCDEAVATVAKLGGRLIDGPMDSPFGRIAAVSDQQGASFAVIDMEKRTGEMPRTG